MQNRLIRLKENINYLTCGFPLSICCFIWVLFTFHNLNLPVVVGVGLDDSMNLFSSYTAIKNYQFGEDCLFNHGPLGWLILKGYIPSIFFLKTIFNFIISATIGFFITRILLSLKHPAIIVAGLYIFLLSFAHFWYYTAVLALLFYLFFYDEISLPHKMPVLFFLAFLSLTKFPFFLMIIPTLCILFLYYWICLGNRRNGFIIIFLFSAFFLILWKMAGQSITSLPAWLFGSLEITRGYSEAMALQYRPDTIPKVEIFLTVIAYIFWYGGVLLLIRWNKIHKQKIIYLFAFFVLYGFMQWKAAFVRHDLGHVLFIPLTVPPAIFLSLLLTSNVNYWQKVSSKIFITAAIFLILGLYQYVDKGISSSLNRITSIITYETSNLLNLRKYQLILNSRYKNKEGEFRYAVLRSAVGNKTVDLMTADRQGILMLNQWNYRPRPVHQSHQAYTPYLAKRNADFINSEKGPAFILFDIEPIDGRFPALDDGLALTKILSLYSPIAAEKTVVLLKRNNNDLDAEPVRLREVDVKWGEELNLNEFKGKMIVVSADIKYSLFGKIVKFIYKVPGVYVKVRINGQEKKYRIIPGMCRTGFLIQPLVTESADLISLSTSSNWRMDQSVESMKFIFHKKGNAKYFSDNIRLTFDEIQIRALSNTIEGKTKDFIKQSNFNNMLAFRSNMRVLPYERKFSYDLINGNYHWNFLAHSPSKGNFVLPKNAHRINIGFGIKRGAYNGEATTDGAEFRLILRSPDGTVQHFWSRYLNPINETLDRGPQRASIVLPAFEDNTEIFVETLPGNTDAWDWTYFYDLEIMDIDGIILKVPF